MADSPYNYPDTKWPRRGYNLLHGDEDSYGSAGKYFRFKIAALIYGWLWGQRDCFNLPCGRIRNNKTGRYIKLG